MGAATRDAENRGHRRGAQAVKRVLRAAQYQVRYLTLYAFSVENWNRPKDEIDGLMQLLDRFLKISFLH